MGIIRIDFEFLNLPISWSKKSYKNELYNKCTGNFGIINRNCGVSRDIENKNVKDICELSHYISQKYPNSKIQAQEKQFDGDEKSIKISIPSFVKKFQGVYSTYGKTCAIRIRAQKELVNICLNCKNCKTK